MSSERPNGRNPEGMSDALKGDRWVPGVLTDVQVELLRRHFLMQY